MTKEELNDILKKSLSDNKLYQEILEIVRKNSQGKIWLIGGWVYRTLTHNLYGCQSPIKDFDFIVKKINKSFLLPEGWEETKTRHGNPRFKKERKTIDLIALDNIHSIKMRGLKPTIENYLSGTPLTIQAMAFDVDNQTLIGEAGIKSLLAKTVAINDRQEFNYAAGIYGDLFSIKRCADELGFIIKE